MRHVLSVAALSALVVTACQPPPKPAKGGGGEEKAAGRSAKTPEQVVSSGTGPVAKVNGEELSRADFDGQMARTRARFQRAGRDIAPALEKRLKENLIRKMVDEALIRQKAKGEGVQVTPDELEAKFAEHKKRFGNDKAFTAFLERTKQSETNVKGDLEKNLLRDKLFGKLMQGGEPTEDDARKYYEDNKKKYKQREQVKASHILLKVAKDATPAQKKEKLAKANQALKRANKGEDFATLAKEYSEGPTAKRGGDLGKFSKGRMVKPFEEAAFGASAGQVVGPIETQFGFHVIKVFEKFPERERPYDEVKESILTSLKARQKSKATRDILNDLKAKANVEVLEPGVSLTPKRRRPPITASGKPMAKDRDLKALRERAKQAAERAHARMKDAKPAATAKPAAGK